MDFEFDSPKEYPLDFSRGLSLQAMASTKLALRLWQHKMCKGVTHYNPSVWLARQHFWFEESHTFSCQEVVDAPTRIRDVIDERILLVRDELRIWLKKFAPVCTELLLLTKFSDNLDGLISTLFENMVLKPDNTICLESSARNVLMNVPLNLETKYKMACEFCLEDCIRLYWPLVENNILGKEQSLSQLVVYWNNIMIGKVVDIPPPLLERNPIILLVRENNKAAFTYFWNKLNEHEQIILTIGILRIPRTIYSTMKFTLAKLNQTQASIVCREVGDEIFITVMKTDQHFEYPINYWIYMKELISENMFSNIIRQSWQMVVNYSELYVETTNRRGDLLRKVWFTASDRLKAAVLNRDMFVGLFASFDDQVRCFDTSDTKFVLALLTNANYELRRAVWMENWRKLIVRVAPSKLEKLIGLSLADQKEIEQFKEHRMANYEELEPYFSSCIEKKFFAELCEYLNFCVKDPRRLENLSEEIIFSNLHAIVSYVDENELTKFHSFIRGTFRDSQSAHKFIEKLILAPEFLALIHSRLDDGVFDEVINVSSRFSTSERHLNKMKRGLLDYCKSNLARGQITEFVGQKFEYFLRWCSLNEASIFEFKQSLVIDDIFEIVVKKVIQRESALSHPSRTLLDFNNFLEWYFGSSEKARIYKSSESVDRALKWAFDGDAEKIDIVKSVLLK